MNDEHLPPVQILLSTYNGERYLKEQLDSLLAQDYPNIHILIRDDGSTDNTLNILEPYLSEKVMLIRGSNIGVVRSYFALLEASSPRAAFIAFCDQDDVWLPHKVSRAVQRLGPKFGPALYCSSLILTDKNLNKIGSIPLIRRKPSLANALLENIATGCTTVLNKAAVDLLVRNIPNLLAVRMHDRWFYQTISALGEITFDPEATIFYRQHTANVVGAKSTRRERWLQRLQLYRKGHLHQIRDQAAEFLRTYDALLQPEDREVVEELLSAQATLKNRLRYFMWAKTYRQRFWDTLVLRGLIAAGLV